MENIDSPMLEMQMKEHTPKVGSVPENTKLVEEESKMESPVQLKERERLLRELELEPESEELESLTFERELERHVEKLNLLLKRKKMEQERVGQKSVILEVELEKYVEELKFLLEKKIPRDEEMRSVELKECLAKETSLVDKMKSTGEESKIK